MNKYICLLMMFALSSVAVSAECKPGYQSAKVVRVLHVSPGVSAPARAAGDEVCFRKEGKMIRVLTGDGKPLPGAAHPIHQTPQTQ